MASETQWPEAVVFDLDGTLADTVLDLAAALNRTLAELDLPPHPPEAVRTMVGGGLAKLLERGLAAHAMTLDHEAMSRAGQILFDHYAARPAMYSSLYPGAANALGALREAGVALGVCTNKPDAIALDLLRTLGMTHAFGFVQGSEEGLAKKPDPAGMHRVLRQLGAAPSASFMVGDSVTDVATARAAGLAGVILVSYGYTAIPARALGADAVIDHLDEVPGTLARLAARQKHEA
jgi:phosphoglycolate phosphatase